MGSPTLDESTNDLVMWWGTIDWGTAPEWVAAIGTVAAFLLAAIGYLWSVQLSRKAQARKIMIGHTESKSFDVGETFQRRGALIASSIGFGTRPATVSTPQMHEAIERTQVTWVEIVNHSDETMAPILIELVSAESGELVRGGAPDFPRILPGEKAVVTIVRKDSWYPAPANMRVRVIFRDAAGRWWQRFENEEVRAAPKHLRPKHSDSALEQKFRAKSSRRP